MATTEVPNTEDVQAAQGSDAWWEEAGFVEGKEVEIPLHPTTEHVGTINAPAGRVTKRRESSVPVEEIHPLTALDAVRQELRDMGFQDNTHDLDSNRILSVEQAHHYAALRDNEDVILDALADQAEEALPALDKRLRAQEDRMLSRMGVGNGDTKEISDKDWQAVTDDQWDEVDQSPVIQKIRGEIATYIYALRTQAGRLEDKIFQELDTDHHRATDEQWEIVAKDPRMQIIDQLLNDHLADAYDLDVSTDEQQKMEALETETTEVVNVKSDNPRQHIATVKDEIRDRILNKHKQVIDQKGSYIDPALPNLYATDAFDELFGDELDLSEDAKTEESPIVDSEPVPARRRRLGAKIGQFLTSRDSD